MPTTNAVKSSFFTEVPDEDGRYFYKKTPVGSYTFRFFQDWDGNEKPAGELTFFSPETDTQNLMEGSFQDAEKFARKHLKGKLAEDKKQDEKEEKILSLEDQLLEFAKKFRSAKSSEEVIAQYRLLLQQAQSLGLISNPVRLKINRMNKSIGGISNLQSSSKDLEVMAGVMELLAVEARKVSANPSPNRVASLWLLRRGHSAYGF
jgi:hypothetical protein